MTPVATEPAPPGQGGAERHRIYVCRTCARYEPPPGGPGSATKGQLLARQVKARFQAWRWRDRFTVLAVNCLSGCPNPCNVAFAGPGKYRVRINRFEPGDADQVLRIAALHLESTDGDLDRLLPPSERGRISARTPPAMRASLGDGGSGAP